MVIIVKAMIIPNLSLSSVGMALDASPDRSRLGGVTGV
jgi:hypothetical protein